MKTVRVFVSSPGDVGRERDAAQKVIARLRAQFSGRLSIEPYFWEHEPMHAGADFQGQIPPPAEFQIFVGMLWSRLGTRLNRTYTRPDGTRYQSGTEYEFETALEAYRKSEQKTPRLLIYRRTEIPSFPAEPPELRQDRENQWEALKGFLNRWFKDAADGGTFRAAYNSYGNTAVFEEKLESHLQKLLWEFLKEDPQPGFIAAAATWVGKSPYRGLKTFEFEHSPVFFGRTQSIDQVIGQLSDREREEKCPFVLIFGSSGSGKSSLLRAGILPAIANGAVDGIGLWRRALMQPSSGSGDLFDGLASALTEPNAVPELLVGGMSIPSLAEMLRVNAKNVGLLLRGALPQIAQQAHEAEKRRLHELATACRAERRVADADYTERLIDELRYPEPRLILALDQLEEVFTTGERFSSANRKAFFESICSLLESHFVWVVATLRSDFFSRCEELPDLVRLKAGKGQFHLLPPSAVELAQMIRLPAQAAGVPFEDHPELGRLEDVLRDAAMADKTSLPLLEFALEALFEAGQPHGMLRHSDYQSLAADSGSAGLRGVLVKSAEQVYGKLSSAARGVFADAFLGLATTDSVATGANGPANLRFLRRVVRQPGATETGKREVYETFVRARLLVADADAEGHEVVTVAHEALLNEWPRLRELLEHEISYLRMRARVSTAAAQWAQEARRPQRLATGVTLAEAKEIATREELDPQEADFIRLSVRKSRRRLMQWAVTGIVLVLAFAALAGIALLSAREAARRKHETNRVLALSDLSRAQDLLDQNDGDAGLAYLARAGESDTEIAKPAAARLWFALTERTWPLPTSATMRHHDAILSVALSPDGSKILTGSKDNTAGLWSATSGLPLFAPLNLPNFVRTTAFSPDGRHLYTGCFDGTGTLWRLENTSAAKVWTKQQPNEITAVAFAPSGKTLVTGCRDGSTRIWSVADGNLVGEFPGPENVHTIIFKPGDDDTVLTISGATVRLLRISEHRELFNWKHEGEINAAAFNGDGTLVATAGDKPFLQIWRTDNGSAWGPAIPHNYEVTEVQFSRENMFATIAGGRAFVWKSDGKPAFEGTLHVSAAVSTLRFSPDGLRVFTGAEDGQVQTWNALTGSALGESIREREPIVSLIPSPDNRHLIVTTADNTVRNWSMPTLSPLGFELYHPAGVESMATDGEGRTAVTICTDGKARVWNTQTGNIAFPPLQHPGSAVTAAITPDGKYVATGGADATLRLWDTSTGAAVGKPISFDTTVTTLAFIPSGSYLIAASQSGLLRTFTVPELRQLHEQNNHRAEIRFVGFDNNGAVVIASADGNVKVEKAETGESAGRAIQAGKKLTAAAITPDGRFIATASGGTGQIWDAHTGNKIGEPLPHKAAIGAMLFTRDSRFLLTASDDRTAVIWDVRTGRPISGALMHSKPVCAIAVSPDSSRLATGTEEGIVRIWDVKTGQALSEGLKQAGPIRSLAFAGPALLLSASSDGTVAIWDLATGLSSVEEAELATFARALSSASLGESGRLSWRPPLTIDELRQMPFHGDRIQHFRDWFFGNRRTRTLTPFSRWTVNDYVTNLRQQGTLESKGTTIQLILACDQ